MFLGKFVSFASDTMSSISGTFEAYEMIPVVEFGKKEVPYTEPNSAPEVEPKPEEVTAKSPVSVSGCDADFDDTEHVPRGRDTAELLASMASSLREWYELLCAGLNTSLCTDPEDDQLESTRISDTQFFIDSDYEPELFTTELSEIVPV